MTHNSLNQNLRPTPAAEYLGVSASHLAKLRMPVNHGKGPVFSKVAGCIIYRREDLDKWLNDNRIEQAA